MHKINNGSISKYLPHGTRPRCFQELICYKTVVICTNAQGTSYEWNLPLYNLPSYYVEQTEVRAQDKVHIFISVMPISSLNPMFDHLLESSHRDDSNKWSNI